MHHYREDEGLDPFAGFRIIEIDRAPGMDDPVLVRPVPRTPEYQTKINKALDQMQASLAAQAAARVGK